MKKCLNVAISGISLFMSVLLLAAALILPASANDAPSPPENVDGRAYCLYDLTHGKLVASKNMDEVLPTSTSAKVMMGLIACETLKDRLDESVLISSEMIEGVSGYSMKLSVGEEIKIRDLLYGAICASYNDAAYVLAHLCSDSVSKFVSDMNSRATSLGARSTVYINPIGFPDNSAMVTTLSDTLKIAIAASQNELYMEICSAIKYQISSTNMSDSRTIYNRNHLVSSRTRTDYYNPSCHGMNAGISGEAGGWSIVTLCEDDGAQYLCIVLGGTESEDGTEIYAYQTVNTLADWAQDTYNNYLVFKKGQVIGQVKVGLTALGSSNADYTVPEDLSIYIPDHSNPDISYKVEFNSDGLRAPVKAGEEVGSIKIFCNGELVGSYPLVLCEDQEANAIMIAIDVIGQYTKSRAFIATLICFAVLLTVTIISNRKRNYFGGKYKRRY